MITLIRREFIVEQPIASAWQHLARLAEWPSWAKHMQQVDVQPPGVLSAKSTTLIHLGNGVKCAFQVTESTRTAVGNGWAAFSGRACDGSDARIRSRAARK
jgi:hypothetical protein